MRLKDKFNNLVPIEFGGMQEPLLSDCEKIVDEFAIDFGEWLEKLIYSVDKPTYELYLKNKIKELLKDFKKQKGYE
jgi:hypothetical protein